MHRSPCHPHKNPTQACLLPIHNNTFAAISLLFKFMTRCKLDWQTDFIIHCKYIIAISNIIAILELINHYYSDLLRELLQLVEYQININGVIATDKRPCSSNGWYIHCTPFINQAKQSHYLIAAIKRFCLVAIQFLLLLETSSS